LSRYPAILGAFGVNDDLCAAMLEGGQEAHVLENELGPLLESAGRKFDLGALGAGVIAVPREHGLLGKLGSIGEGVAC
jgi:hypothetical protein